MNSEVADDMQTVGERRGFIRRAMFGARLVQGYPFHFTLTERQLRALVAAESSEALKLARDAGLVVPHANP